MNSETEGQPFYPRKCRQVRGTAEWHRACLASTRSYIQFLVQKWKGKGTGQERKEERKKGREGKGEKRKEKKRKEKRSEVNEEERGDRGEGKQAATGDAENMASSILTVCAQSSNHSALTVQAAMANLLETSVQTIA